MLWLHCFPLWFCDINHVAGFLLFLFKSKNWDFSYFSTSIWAIISVILSSFFILWGGMHTRLWEAIMYPNLPKFVVKYWILEHKNRAIIKQVTTSFAISLKTFWSILHLLLLKNKNHLKSKKLIWILKRKIELNFLKIHQFQWLFVDVLPE